MVLDLEIEGLRRAPATHFDVGVLVGTDRHRLVWQVGNAQQHGIQFALDGVQLSLAFLQLGAHAVDIGQQRRDVLATLLGLADRLGTRVALGLQLLGTGLYRLALLFQRFDACDIQLEATGGQAGSHFLRLGAYQFGIEHALFSSRVGYRRFVARLALRRPRRRHRRRRGSLASSAEPIPLRIFCVGGDWCDPARPGVPACRGSSVPGPSAPVDSNAAAPDPRGNNPLRRHRHPARRGRSGIPRHSRGSSSIWSARCASAMALPASRFRRRRASPR